MDKIETFAKGMLETHTVYARKYAAEGQLPVAFVLVVPKDVVLGAGVARSIAGDVVGSLLAAVTGEA